MLNIIYKYIYIYSDFWQFFYLFRFCRDSCRCFYKAGETGAAAVSAAPTQATDIGDLSSGDSSDSIILYALRERNIEHQTSSYVCEQKKRWKFQRFVHM